MSSSRYTRSVYSVYVHFSRTLYRLCYPRTGLQPPVGHPHSPYTNPQIEKYSELHVTGSLTLFPGFMHFYKFNDKQV